MTKEFKRILIILFLIYYNFGSISPILTFAYSQSSTPSATLIPVDPSPKVSNTPISPTPIITSAPPSTPPPVSPPQSASPIPQDSSPEQLNPSPSLAPPITPSVTPAPLDLTPGSSIFSGLLRQKLKLLPLEKDFFLAREKINAKLIHDYGEEIDIAVRNSEGVEIPVIVERKIINEESTLDISPYSPSGFRPGKYRLMITDSDGNSHDQDFTWGVLAIN